MSDRKHDPSIDDLQPDPKNANKGSDRGRALVEASLQECGAGRSILVDRDGTTIAGAKTLEAAQKLGLPVKIVETAGDELVVVRRGDLDLASDARARRLAFYDNRSSELGLEWDCEQLLADIQGGVDLTGIFERPELDALLAAVLQREGLCDPDSVPEVPEEPTSRPGDLWLCGEQRVLCGDATCEADVRRLLDGGEPRLLVTDPPYGVQLDLRWRDEIYNKLGPAARPYMMEGHTTTGMSGDTRADWSDAYELVPSLEVGLVWHAGVHAVTVGAGLERIGFAIRSQVIWKKPLFVISRGAFAWQHEPAYYVVKRGVVAGWTGSHESTVLEVASPKQIMAGSDEEKFDHPVQKPCLCMSLVIAHHHGDAYDPFLGSGTTLIAAESLGRRCYGLEIDPRFCDVICQRWVSYSGKQPILEGDGRSFEEISVKRTSGNTPQGNATP